jgi:predicted NBD/HSP70 family sugar kinase
MFIACDIGGTKFRIARSDDLENFDDPIIKDTPDNPEEGLKIIIDTMREIAEEDMIEGITIGIAGVISADHSSVVEWRTLLLDFIILFYIGLPTVWLLGVLCQRTWMPIF